MAKQQQRPVVPQFGNWDGKNNIPYTIYFDEARKAKNGGKMINPNDPMEYPIPGMFPCSPPQATPSRNVREEPIGGRGVRPSTLDSQSRETGDMKFTDGPGPQSNDNKRPTIPQFGKWDGENNTPYTIYFDEARKAKNGGKMINPNDPMEYPIPGMFPFSPPGTPSRARNVPEEPIGGRAVRPTMLDSQSRQNGDMKKYTEGPLSNDNVSHQRGTGSTLLNRRGSGVGSGQPGRQNGGLVHSIDQSPLHQAIQAKRNEKSSASPAWESKHSNGRSNATPGRSRMKPVSTAIKYPVKGAAVPSFGEWDDTNPASGHNFTDAFDRIISNVTAEQAYATRQKQNDRNNYKSRCFPCFFGKQVPRTLGNSNFRTNCTTPDLEIIHLIANPNCTIPSIVSVFKQRKPNK